MNFKNYFEELKRRNVFKAALAYIVVSWIIIQVASIVFPAFNASKAAIRTILIILVIGFPVWLVFAWVYEVTPEGLKKTEKVDRKESITAQTSNKFNKLILGALAIAIILLGVDVYGTYLKKDNPGKNHFDNTTPFKPSSEISDKSIAVLAFEDMSPKHDQEYFSDGISEEILNQLAKSPKLTVMSRTSSFYFKGKEATTSEIGQKLHVNYLLEGSVRKAGNTVRITAQLINISNGAHIWSETYDRQLEDIFKIQDEIAIEVSNKLEASVLGEKVHEVDTRAYTLYLKAKHLKNQFTTSSLEKALELLKQSAVIDPNYAPTWAEMSYAYFALGFYLDSMDQDEAKRLCLSSATRSVAIDPDYAYGYLMLSKAYINNFDWIPAKKNAQKAYQLDPENPEILSRVSLYSFGSVTDMIANTKKSIKLDPLNYNLYYNLSLHYFFNEEFKKAIETMKTYEEFQPNTEGAKALLANYYLFNHQPELAEKTLNKEKNKSLKQVFNIKVLYGLGKEKQAQHNLAQYILENKEDPAGIASLFAFMGNNDMTFEWLQKALEAKDQDLSEYIYFPEFKKFHDDPRWQKVLEEMGVPEDNGIPGYKQS